MAAPEGTMTWGIHITLASRWLDPAETEGIITPFMVLYAIHDALVKPMPAGPNTPSLAESWSVSKDGLTYEFVLRKLATFHNGDPVSADDVKFSFDRYKGAAAKLLKDKVREVQVVDARRVRFHLKEPWPDFMTFYGTSASGAAWIVPRKYVEKVGDDGFKKAPVGAGPYKVVSFTPGVELVMEAFDGYWRKTPSVKRLVFRSIPEEATRAAALKNGEVDVVYLLSGPIAEDVRRTPSLQLVPSQPPAVFWLEFLDQWDPKSPWHDRRVRLAASLAIDREAVNQPRRWASRDLQEASFHESSSTRCPSTRPPTIPSEPESSSPRRVTPTASTQATFTRSLRTPRWGRPWPVTCRRSGSGRGSRRWSGRRSSPRGERRSSRVSWWASPARRAMRRRVSRPTSPGAGSTRTGSSRRSRICSSARPGSRTGPGARPSCTRSRRSSTS